MNTLFILLIAFSLTGLKFTFNLITKGFDYYDDKEYKLNWGIFSGLLLLMYLIALTVKYLP